MYPKAMTWEERFRASLKRIRTERGLDAANLSLAAGLNRRAVTDIEIGAAKSPKLSTAMALSEALDVPLSEMLGPGSPDALLQEWVDFLAQYDEEDQRNLLRAVQALRIAPREKS